MAKETDIKRQIFLVSAELFAKDTYSRVSVRDIAKKVGIRSSSIYYYYKSKEEILDELLQYYVSTTETFFQLTSKKMSKPDYVPDLMDVFYQYSPDEAKLMFCITRIIYMEQFTSPVATEALIGKSHQHYSEGYRMFFSQLYRHGYIKQEENVEYYADMFTRMGHSYQLDYVHPGYMIGKNHLIDMYRFLLRLILSNEGTLDRYQELVKF